MKKIRFFLPVLAFLFAFGIALASSVADFDRAYPNVDSTPCDETLANIDNASSITCDFPSTQTVCTVNSGANTAYELNGITCQILYKQ